jgi:Phytanoyl-CoA dioxygenase (PhyH)
MITREELYEFDLRGFVVCRQVLSRQEVARCLASTDGCQAAKHNGKFSFFELDPFFVELMARPRTLGILKAMLGEWLRFDHAFGLWMTRDEEISENLHGGPLQNQRAFWYQWSMQSMHNGLVKVLYALNDVHPGDGGFICVPGSHKGNVPYLPPHDSPFVVNPTLQAGDMLIFTEALVHGSRQWIADRPRRVLIYSYGPGCLAWKAYDSIKPYLALATTDVQRDLLRPPYVGDYDERQGARTGAWGDERRAPLATV